MSFITISLAIFLLCAYILRVYSTGRRRYPPGPQPLPFIGNILDFPRDKPWSVCASWKEQYGDVIYMKLMGTPIIVLNSLKACTDLLEKRSTKYSDRPQTVMNELIGFGYSFASMSYSPRWRKHRRLFHQYFNEKAVHTYQTKQIQGVHHFLQRLLAEPDKFLEHSHLLFGEVILDIVYDIHVEDGNSIFIRAAEKAIQIALHVAIPGQFLVDIFPLLNCIPSWSPGAAFKRKAAVWKRDILNFREIPFAYVDDQMNKGTAGPSVLRSMLARSEDNSAKGNADTRETPEEVAKSCAAVAYAGGADTSLSTIQAFFMAMANNLEIQKAAQMELDALLDNTRLPTFEDQANLPTVNAIVKELIRWHTVLPLGFPRLLTEDDEYNGYFIPKGTVVLPNAWSIMHDPDVYTDPLKFNPWRWLNSTPEGPKINLAIQDPSIASFGFGRRICPGRHFATSATFITIANVLACFNIKPLDAHGKPADQVEEVFTTNAIATYPVPYNVLITPRSDSIVQLVKDDPSIT